MKEKKEKTHIMAGNIITDEMNPKKGFDKAEELKDAFSQNSIIGKRTNDSSADHRATREARKEKEKAEIQDVNWETVRKSTRLDINNVNGKAIVPSYAAGEHLGPGNLKVPSDKASIHNPDAFKSVKNDEFTDHVIQAGRDRRKQAAERKERDRSWELDNKARTTADVPASALGFTPHRTAFVPQELPKVKEPKSIAAQRDKVEQSVKAANILADIKTKKDNLDHIDRIQEAKDNRRWQDVAADKINKSLNKDFSSSGTAPEMTEAGVIRDTKYDKDLSGIFKLPPKPGEVKEKKIKRKADIKAPRKDRSEDRSWENVEVSKAKKF